MEATLFLFRLEEEIKRMKFELENVYEKKALSTQFTTSKDRDEKYEEKIESMKLHFLMLLHNTELIYHDTAVNPVGFLAYKALELEKVPPYAPRYPFILWLMCKFGKEKVIEVFGETFCRNMGKIVSSRGLSAWMCGDD